MALIFNPVVDVDVFFYGKGKHAVISRRDTWSRKRLPTRTIDGSVESLKRAKTGEGHGPDVTDTHKSPSFPTKANQMVDRTTGILHTEQVRSKG